LQQYRYNKENLSSFGSIAIAAVMPARRGGSLQPTEALKTGPTLTSRV
jgi:hypothetical protein